METDRHVLNEAPPSGDGASWTWPDGPGPGRLPLLFVTVVLTYGAGSEIALRLVSASGLQGVLFIPAGITVAFLLRLPRRFWWIVLVAAGLTEFVMDVSGGFSSKQALGFAAANTIEPLIGAAIVTTTCGAIDLARRRHVSWYTLGAVVVGPAVGAALGAGADRLFGSDEFVTTFLQWWLGDALGVVLVGSAILVWGSSPDRLSVFSFWGGALVTGSVVLTVVVLAFTDLPLVFSVLIGVVLAGVLFGVRAVAMTALAVALTIALLLTVDPGDLIIGLTRASALMLIQVQVAMFTLAGLLIAAESLERDLATRQAATASLAAREAERARRREHDLAVQIQRSLLPDRLPQRPGLQVAARYEAANEALEVGGDWYDAVELDDGRVGLVVGDIVGHGIKAMTSMGRLRTALSALAIHNDDPASLLSAVDDFVSGPDGTGYATVFYAIVDTERETIEYSSAGHPPGLIVSGEGDTYWLDQGQGQPLYGERSRSRPNGTAPLVPGSYVILYSDGLIERRGQSLDVGLARLEHLAAELASRRPEAICDELFSRFGVGVSREDDVVVLVMRIEPSHSPIYHERFPARAEELRKIRASVATWAQAHEIPEATTDDLLISIGEATANAVRHAYQDRYPGQVDVRITPEDHLLDVAIIDTGTWRVPSGDSEYPGMGRLIIRAVAQEFHTETTEHATQVTFRIPIATSSG